MKVRNPSRLKMIHLSRIVDFTNFPVLPYQGDAAATMSEAIHSLQCVKDSTPPRDLQYCHVLWSRTIVFQQFHINLLLSSIRHVLTPHLKNVLHLIRPSYGMSGCV